MGRGGDVVTTARQLIERVGAYLSGVSVSQEMLANRERILHTWFDRRDGRSTDRHAAIIREFLENGGGGEVTYRPGWADASAIAKTRLRRLLGLNDHDSLRFWRRETREKFFTEDEVRAWMEKIAAVVA
jgi:hypothetical protein